MSTRKQIEELITGYLSGNTNKEDTERLVAWIKESPDNLRYYQRLKNIWQVSHPAFGADTIQVASANEKMMSRITPVKWYESRFIRYWQYAAAILLLPLVVFSSYLFISNQRTEYSQVAYQEVFAPYGTHSRVNLPDGSLVWLNAGSSLKYPTVFDWDKRQVELSGEAYFEVAADPDRLFVVEGGGVVVKVHGTVFNMKAREKQDHVDVSLLSGLVVVENHGVSRSLNPGETAVCKKSVPSIEKKTTDVSISCLWAKESLRFEKKTIYELTGYLSEWYGMDIRLDPSLPTDQAYTFTITHESLEEVLCLIAKITPIEYVFDEDNTVRITRK